MIKVLRDQSFHHFMNLLYFLTKIVKSNISFLTRKSGSYKKAVLSQLYLRRYITSLKCIMEINITYEVEAAKTV